MARSSAHPIVQQLYLYRKMMGLNITEVAEKAGVDRGAISKAELGFQDPRLATLHAWAQALGFSFELSAVEGVDSDDRDE